MTHHLPMPQLGKHHLYPGIWKVNNRVINRTEKAAEAQTENMIIAAASWGPRLAVIVSSSAINENLLL